MGRSGWFEWPAFVANPEEARRLEQALAAARGALAAVLAGAAWLTPAASTTAARITSLVYAAAAAAAIALLRSGQVGVPTSRLIHAVDLAAVLVLLLTGAGGFVLAALFPIAAAAYRWGFRETVATGLLLAGPLLVSPRIAGAPLGAGSRAAASVVAAAALLGYLSGREKALRAESSQAKAMDRALVARELHDGAIQSLIAMEVQVDVLRRGAEREGSPITADLERLQEMLRRETLNLRELMQQMKPLELDPKQLPDFLAQTVDRFWRDTGITASFVSNLERVDLSPRICREVARIAQEALVNVRKHSGARNVVVRLGSGGAEWKLVVDDDGHGFDFEGRLGQTELDAARKGPVIIKERVRAIGGELTIESARGRGARLEITFPGAA